MPSSANQTLQDFVKERRVRAGLSQQGVRDRALANGDVFTVTVLSLIETGKQRTLTRPKAEVLARALDLTPAQTKTLMTFTTPEAKTREIAQLTKRLEAVEAAVLELNAELRLLVAELRQPRPPQQ